MTAELRTERDEYLDGLPQTAPVMAERAALLKAQGQQIVQEEEDKTLTAMRADIRRMLVEIKWSVLNQLMLSVSSGEMSDSDLIALYAIVRK